MRPLAVADVLHLVAPMRDYGPTTLVWVEVQDRRHPAGTIERIALGLIKGYIDCFAPGINAHALSLEGWTTLCRKVRTVADRLVSTRPSIV